MTYSLKDAMFLKHYYLEKMVGKYLDDSKQVKIKEIIIEQIESDKAKFFVKVNGQPQQEVFVFFREIGAAAKLLNLLSPNEVLTELNQPE